MKKVDVIIPCHNVEKYIGRCLNSVLKQTIGLEKINIILIDDASEDNTLEYLKAFEQMYSDSVILVTCENNVKAAAARNIGLSYTTGDYITFIDADDMIADVMLEKMVSCIEKYNCDMVECEYETFSDENQCIAKISNEGFLYNLDDENVRRDYIVDIGIKSAVWGRLYKRSFIENNNLRFIEGAIYEDVHYTGIGMFMMSSAYKMSDVLYFYYNNSNGIIGSSDKYKLKQEVDIIRQMLVELNNRDLLDEILEKYYQELEYYCVRKSYLDPITMLIRNSQEDIEGEIPFYKTKIKEIFPNVENNVYVGIIKNRHRVVNDLIDVLRT